MVGSRLKTIPSLNQNACKNDTKAPVICEQVRLGFGFPSSCLFCYKLHADSSSSHPCMTHHREETSSHSLASDFMKLEISWLFVTHLLQDSQLYLFGSSYKFGSLCFLVLRRHMFSSIRNPGLTYSIYSTTQDLRTWNGFSTQNRLPMCGTCHAANRGAYSNMN